MEIKISIPRRFWGDKVIVRNLPARWQDLEMDKCLSIFRILLQPNLTPDAARVLALRQMLDVSDSIWRLLPTEDIAAMLTKMPWLEAKPDPVPMFLFFKHNGRRFYFPLAHGLNIRAIEYPIADEALIAFLKDGDPKQLLLLTATLCREGSCSKEEVTRRGDPRVPLISRWEAEARAKKLEGLPIEFQMAALLFFAGVREYVHCAYGMWLFESTSDDEETKAQQATEQNLGWWSLYFNLAQDGPFGKIEQVYQTEFHDVCLYLIDRKRAERNAQIQQKLAALSPNP